MKLELHVNLENLPRDSERRLIDEGLDIFNREQAGPDGAEDIWVIARDLDGSVQGGLKGRTYYS